LNVSILLAPLTPFIAELLYQNLSRALPDGSPLKAKSVHFVMIPEADKSVEQNIVTAMSRMQSVIELGRTCRERKKVGLKTGLRSMTVINKDEGFINDIRALEAYVLAELNVEEVKFDSNSDNVECTAEPNWKLLGKKLGKNMKAVAEEIKNLSQEALTRFDSSGEIVLCGPHQ